MYKLNINEFVKEVGENAINHGWLDQERSFGELIALCHSELSEALEEFRDGMDFTDEYYTCKIPYGCALDCKSGGDITQCDGCEYAKPEGIPAELADTVIRIFDICHHYGIDLEAAIIKKHEFNKTRPYKHGGKVI